MGIIGPLLALAAAFGWGLADFLGGTLAKRARALVVALVSQIAGALFLGIVLLITARAAPSGQALWPAVLAGIAGTLGMVGLYQALAVGTMGVVAPIASASVVLPVVAGIASGDSPSELQVAGLITTFTGIILVTGSRQTAGRRRFDRSIALAIAAALGIGCVLILLDRAAQNDPLWAVFVFRCSAVTSTAIALVLARLRRSDRPGGISNRGMLLQMVPIGVIDTGANIMYSVSTTHGTLSIMAMLSSTYPIIIAVLARVFLDQTISNWQSTGILMAAVGVAALTSP